MNEGVKYDTGKPRYDLLPPDALEELVGIYTMGAKKYGDRNWESGISYGRVYGAIMRHLWAWWRGQENDDESGCSHLAHAAWGCFALIAYQQRGLEKQLDDRNLFVSSNKMVETAGDQFADAGKVIPKPRYEVDTSTSGFPMRRQPQRGVK